METINTAVIMLAYIIVIGILLVLVIALLTDTKPSPHSTTCNDINLSMWKEVSIKHTRKKTYYVIERACNNCGFIEERIRISHQGGKYSPINYKK